MKEKILVVSQDLNLTEVILNALKHEGYEVITNDKPMNATNDCQMMDVDLVLLDVHIRDISYDKLASEIKKACPDTAIVIITTYAIPESMEKGEALDIGGYLIQPVTEDKIRNITNRVLRQGQVIRENRKLLSNVTIAKKQWEAVVDAIDDPIFITDFDHNILRANLATYRRLGKGVKDVLGHKCYKIFHCSDHVVDNCPGQRAKDGGEMTSEIISFKGLKQRLSCNVYPQVLSGGSGLVHFLHEPSLSFESQAEVMTTYERIFDDAVIPILIVGLDDFKVVDANLKALEMIRREPERLFDADLEDLFAPALRESTIDNIIKQIEGSGGVSTTRILSDDGQQIDVYVIVNTIEIKNRHLVEIFVIPQDIL